MSREIESLINVQGWRHSKNLSEDSLILSSAPPLMTTTPTETTQDGDAVLAVQRRPFVAKGSKKMMGTIMRRVNKANPLQYIQKSPSKLVSSFDDDQTPKPNQSLWRMSQTSRQHQFVTDESEDAVLASVEERGANMKRGADGFRPAVPGETPPLGVPTMGNALRQPALRRDSSRSITEKLHAMQLERQKSSKRLQTGQNRRAKTLLTSLERDMSKRGSDAFGLFKPDDDHFWGLNKMYENDCSTTDDTDMIDDDNTITDNDKDQKDENDKRETLPLLSRDTSDYGNGPTIFERQLKARKVLKRSHLNKIHKSMDPKRVLAFLWRCIVHSTLPICVPLFVIAWILFYYCGNPPPPDFLPGTARLSWWFSFTGE
jgi:hypothetical protein